MVPDLGGLYMSTVTLRKEYKTLQQASQRALRYAPALWEAAREYQAGKGLVPLQYAAAHWRRDR